MPELHLPWLELAIVAPLIGALALQRVRDPEVAWRWSLIATGMSLALAVGGWIDFGTLNAFEAHDRGDLMSALLGPEVLLIDRLSAPLLPLAALLYFAITLATLRTKFRRVSFGGMLVSLSLLLALLACRQPWGIIALLAAQAVPPWLELRGHGRPTRVFVLHMLLAFGLLAVGWAMFTAVGSEAKASVLAIGMLTAGVLIRSGVAPLHCWMTDLFE
ncbi:MAG TPA: oxidoreductase, partial [Lacipirellulaceae bacterium]|nr:oxidoreductase [Lacipirellulaceae bacterium]